MDRALADADGGWRTVQVRLELSRGDELGVNLHSTPREEEEDQTQDAL